MKLIGPRPVGFGARLMIVGLMLDGQRGVRLIVDRRIADLRTAIGLPVSSLPAEDPATRRVRTAARASPPPSSGDRASLGGLLLCYWETREITIAPMTHTITLIPGDGIGPEVTEAVLRILAVAGVQIEWDRQEAGVAAFERHGPRCRAELLDSVTRTKVALKGPVTTPIGEGFTSVNVGLRKALDLYANLRPGVDRCPACPRDFRASTWSSCARTPRTSTRGSSTRSCPASSRA